MFRFTIRDVLWLTVVVSLGMGWWVKDQEALLWRRRTEQVVHLLEKNMRTNVEFDGANLAIENEE